MPFQDSRKIIHARVVQYSGTSQRRAVIVWANGDTTSGNAEINPNHRAARTYHFGAHLHALFREAKRQGVSLKREGF